MGLLVLHAHNSQLGWKPHSLDAFAGFELWVSVKRPPERLVCILLLQRPAQSFRLTGAEIAPQTKWMKPCVWTARDDAMLLLGVFRHGVGAWDR